jgi:superfamily II DNA or RNA helicase
MIKIKSATIMDKIYIKEEDIENISDFKTAYTYNIIENFHYTYDYNNGIYTVPSNSYSKLDIEKVEDLRNFEDSKQVFTFKGTLRAEQQDIVDAFFKNQNRIRSGLFQAECGFGKTFVACNMIARANKKTLILVHTKLLFRQWIEELEKQIPGIPIGKVGDSLLDIQDITVGIYKSVLNNLEQLNDKFGVLYTDEAHLSPADMFSSAVNSINCRAKIAITATPRRKDGKHIVFKDYFTPFRVYAKDFNISEIPKVEIVQTDIPFIVNDPKKEWTKQVNKLAQNTNLINLIAKKAIDATSKNRCILILGDRVDWLRNLNKIIPNSILFIGETPEIQRKEILENVGNKYKVILTTKLLDEGISCHRLDTIFLTFPSNNPVKLEQRIGRIIREHSEKENPLIVDFWLKGLIVSRQQESRKNWYIQRGYKL